MALLRRPARLPPALFPALATLVGIAVPAAGPVRAETKATPTCKSDERAVLAGTPVLGGPGLGFEIVTVIEQDGCLLRAQTTEDGSFALVVLEKGKKAGWVATGLVDERLGNLEGDIEPLPAAGTVKAVRTVVLRRAPRFDALSATTEVAAEAELTLQGMSPDRQWFLVEAGPKTARPIQKGKPLLGWVPKYQVAEALPQAGAEPTAGGGAWAAPRLGRVPYAQSEAARRARAAVEAPEGDAKVPSGEGEKAVAASPAPEAGEPAPTAPSSEEDGDADDEDDDDDDAEGAAPDEAAPAEAPPPPAPDAPAPAADGPAPDPNAPDAPAPVEGTGEPAAAPPEAPAALVVLGRTQEAGFHVGYRYWQESYASDARNDPYSKYDWASPAQIEVGGGYSFRGDFPLTFDLRTQLAVGGWMHPEPDNPDQGAPVISSQAHVWPRLGWRLFETASVDVDAGVAAGGDLFFNLNTSQATTLLTGFYAGVGPSLVARSRLGPEGRFGLLVVEASLPVGMYAMFPDPGGSYSQLPACPTGPQGQILGGDPQNPCQDVLVPPLAGQGGTAPDDPDDPNDVPEQLAAAALPVHLAVGADGRLRYQYAFSHLLRLELNSGVTLRQSTIAGAGRRNGNYFTASNIDVVVSAGLGMTFGF